MADNDNAKAVGWSDRELVMGMKMFWSLNTDNGQLSSLLSIIERTNVTLSYKDGIYPPGRNASGFSQKLARLKNSLKREWDGMADSQPLADTPSKPKATPRKRKAKGEDNANGDVDGSPKKRGRGRPKKKTPESKEQEKVDVKEEMQDDEQKEDGDEE